MLFLFVVVILALVLFVDLGFVLVVFANDFCVVILWLLILLIYYLYLKYGYRCLPVCE